MKKQILILATVICIAMLTGCKNQEKKQAGNNTDGAIFNYAMNIVSPGQADSAINNYGFYCKQTQNESATRAWLINVSDFLYAAGLTKSEADSIMTRTRHHYIHAYIGLPGQGLLVSTSNMISQPQKPSLNFQLYIVGADSTYQLGIEDFPAEGIYNLTMPCPNSCPTSGTSLYKAFDSGYNKIITAPNKQQ